MIRPRLLRLLTVALLLLWTVTLVSCDLFGDDDGPGELVEVRQATERYQDLSTAQADGYVQFSPPVPNMGVHYLVGTALSDDATSDLDRSLERKNPEVLVYADTSPSDTFNQLVAVEYAIKKEGESPPDEALTLFSDAGAEEWHVHPSTEELPLSDDWTVHAECHYEGGIGVFLVENPNGDFVLFTPPSGAFGSWGGTVEPGACPSSLGDQELPPLSIVHGKWWTLHAWIWFDNPEGVFHPTNPNVES